MNLKPFMIFGLLLIGLFFQYCHSPVTRSEKETIVVKINTQKPILNYSDDFVGLSYETKQLLPDKNGVHYFRSDNKALLNMIKTLGVKNIRIGGNSVDAASIAIPDEKDIHSFFKFAKVAGVKVIYSVRLKDGEPKSAQRIAKIIYKNYADVLESFSIGNEPGYYKDYDVYVAKWTAIRDAILKVYPEAVFSGPDQNPDAERLKKLVNDFGDSKGRLVQISQHNYPFGCSYKNYKEHDVSKLIPIEADKAREKMLTDSIYCLYNEIWQGMLDAVDSTALSFRLSETNSYWFSGLKGASDSYASALWGLDYMHWWASHGAAGLNFHTGDTTGGDIVLPCRYAVFVSDKDKYEPKPLAYGIKLFSIGGVGQSLPIEITSASNKNIVAYANKVNNDELFVTLINKEFKSSKNSEVCIKLNQSILPKIKMLSLNATNNDIAADFAGITLGDEHITNQGIWNGQWTVLPDNCIEKNKIFVSIAPASAMVLNIKSMKY